MLASQVVVEASGPFQPEPDADFSMRFVWGWAARCQESEATTRAFVCSAELKALESRDREGIPCRGQEANPVGTSVPVGDESRTSRRAGYATELVMKDSGR